ncbi:MAG: PQQ-binding-like beta-propeller repeat protein, partial [Planctomycetota bacterium]
MREKSILAVIIVILLNIQASAADWPQWRGSNRDGVWREKGIVQKFNAPQLPIRWRVKIANGYSGPTVASGRVYVTDRLTTPTA